MLRNLLLVSFRNLFRNRTYSILHVLGLTLGITCALFIAVYILDEIGFDRFHNNPDRIYRIVTTVKEGTKETHYGNTQLSLAPALESEFGTVEKAVRFMEVGRKLVEVPSHDLKFFEEKFYYVDANIFSMFAFPLSEGDPASSFSKPNTAVLTKTTAKKYFGTTDVLGMTFVSDGATFEVSGVAEDCPKNSTIQFDALLSLVTLPPAAIDWSVWNGETYVLLGPGAILRTLETSLASLIKDHVDPMFAGQGIKFIYRAQPLTDMHLHANLNERSGDKYLYIFLAIGIAVVLVASFNYINLATAMAAKRAKEIGIRKTLGSGRSKILTQFILESCSLVLIALVLSVIAALFLLPVFNEIAGKEIAMASLFRPLTVLCLVGLVIFLGLLGGSYPAFYLSNFNPILALKGLTARGTSKANLRKVLVSTQFAISVTLLICTAVVYDQLSYIKSRDLGFQKEHILHFELPDSSTMAIQSTLAEQLKNDHGVVQAASSSSMPGKGVNYNVMLIEGNEGMKSMGIFNYTAGFDYVETMGLQIAQGRAPSRNYATDSTAALVNESFARSMTWEDPIGKRISEDDGDPATKDKYYTVVGVIKDFHQSTLHSQIEPLVIFTREPNNFLNVKIQPGDIPQTIAHISSTWGKLTGGKPFAYSFLDADFDALYKAEQRRGQIFSVFTGTCLLIACIGLLGLTAHASEQRAKEIGIRKVVGASVAGIVAMFYKDYLKLIAAAFILAIPLSYFIMNNWLQSFAYQTGFHVFNVVASVVAVLFVSMASIAFYTIKAARANPATTLKTE